jgi:lysophospholipase L1-like esterase
VFVTGGSTAFGTGAPDDDRTIPGYLERELRTALGRDVEVINAANTAWASTHERNWIEDRLIELEPDLVVSLSGINDVHWALLGRNVLSMRAYADEHWFALVANLYRRAGAPLPDPVEVTTGRVEAPMVARRLARNARSAAASLASEDAAYLFALQPALAVTGKALSRKERWQRSLIDQRFGAGARDHVVQSYAEIRRSLAPAASPRVPFTDLSGVFDTLGADTEIFLDSYHFGDRGNEIIARALVGEVAALLEER